MIGLTKDQMMEEFDKIWKINEELFINGVENTKNQRQLVITTVKDIMSSALFRLMEKNDKVISKQLDEIVQKKILDHNDNLHKYPLYCEFYEK
jgi:hypothetical protein